MIPHFHTSTSLSPGKNVGAHRMAGSVGPRDSLDVLEKIIVSFPCCIPLYASVRQHVLKSCNCQEARLLTL